MMFRIYSVPALIASTALTLVAYQASSQTYSGSWDGCGDFADLPKPIVNGDQTEYPVTVPNNCNDENGITDYGNDPDASPDPGIFFTTGGFNPPGAASDSVVSQFGGSGLVDDAFGNVTIEDHSESFTNAQQGAVSDPFAIGSYDPTAFGDSGAPTTPELATVTDAYTTGYVGQTSDIYVPGTEYEDPRTDGVQYGGMHCQGDPNITDLADGWDPTGSGSGGGAVSPEDVFYDCYTGTLYTEKSPK